MHTYISIGKYRERDYTFRLEAMGSVLRWVEAGPRGDSRSCFSGSSPPKKKTKSPLLHYEYGGGFQLFYVFSV